MKLFDRFPVFAIETETMVFAILSTLGLGMVGLAVFLYYQRQGQFDDVEDVKYQMFREDKE